MERKLRSVEQLSDAETSEILALPATGEEDPEEVEDEST